jgi:MFS family permease
VVVACATGTVTTAWALHLGCGTQLVGLLGALPFLAQLCQLPGAWLTARVGSRRAALATVALSRQCFLPLAALPWLPLGPEEKRAVLVACCAAHHALGILCNNAWTTWVGELVPGRVRGRYFGRRTSICTAATALATVAVGSALDRAQAAELAAPALAGLALVSCSAGALSVALMARQAGGQRGDAPRWRLAAAIAPLRDRRARELLRYLVLWHVAVGFSAPFYGLYLLQDLRAGYTTLAWVLAVAALARMATAPAWGRAVDRVGARPVLLACTAGLALAPLSWIAAARLGSWPLLLDAIVGGALLGGHQVATFSLPLAIAPARERPHYHALFAMAGGGAFALASAAGGALVAAAPDLLPEASGVLPLQLTFAASSAARAAAALAAARIAGAPLVVQLAPAARLPPVRSLAPRAVARAHRYAVRTGRRWMTRATPEWLARAASRTR